MPDAVQARFGAAIHTGHSHSRRVDPNQEAGNSGASGFQPQNTGSLLQSGPDVGSSGLNLLA